MLAHLKKADTFLRDSVIYEPFSERLWRKQNILKTSSQMAVLEAIKLNFLHYFSLIPPLPPYVFVQCGGHGTSKPKIKGYN